MIQIYRLLAIAIVILLGSEAHAEINAETEDGRTVILKEDGSWRFADEEYDFRAVRWGMTGQEVARSEGEPNRILQGQGPHPFKASFYGHEFDVLYYLIDGELAIINLVSPRKSDPALPPEITSANFEKLLTQKYGPPISRKVDERDKRQWGIQKQINWQNDRTLIALKSEDTSPKTTKFMVDYKSRAHIEQIQRAMREFDRKNPIDPSDQL